MHGSLLRQDESPLHRCLSKGPQSLSLRECLATLFAEEKNSDAQGLELALSVLQHPGELPLPEEERAFFFNMESPSLSHLRHLPQIAQARLQAAFELARRYQILRSSSSHETPTVSKSPRISALQDQVSQIIPAELRSATQEWFGFIPLFGSPAQFGNFCLVERGIRTHVHIDPIELFARLLALRPCGFWIAHNHPSGCLQPSTADFDLTSRVLEISQELGIPLMGHAIVCSDHSFLMTG